MFVAKLLPLLATAISTANASPIAAETVPDGVLTSELIRIVNQTSYGVKIAAGTPPQDMIVLVDTGSSQSGFQGTLSNWCKQKNQICKEYGSYNNLTSSTAKYINDYFNNGLINQGSGAYIKDVIHFGGKVVPNIKFGMITDYYASYPAPNPNSGLIGLLPTCKTSSCSVTYNSTLLEEFNRLNLVKERVLGVYLGPEEPHATGMLAMGAFDRAKQKGKIVTLKAIDPLSNAANGSPNLFNYTSFSIRTADTGSSDQKASVKSFPVSPDAVALLDTGNPLFDMPSPAFQYVKQLLNLKSGQSSYSGAYNVHCKYRKPLKGNPTILVGFGNDELKIEIPINTLVSQLGPNKCVATLSNSGSKTGKFCAFGDPFFRNAYVGFDFRDATVRLSAVNYTNKTEYYVPK